MKAAVMGYGTIGRGVCEILTEKEAGFPAKCGGSALGLGPVLDIRDLSLTPVSANWTKNIEDIVGDPEVAVVVETMGGVHPAFEFCTACMNAGKSVVTSNKQLVAEKGEILFDTAQKNNVSFRFGAAVCGGIPVLRTLFYGLAANEIQSFAGILNGTTNFILTKMIREHMTFDAALRLAQENGYAEKDPTADVEGLDACRKTAILASAAFGSHIDAAGIHTEGITRISVEDAACAAAWDAKIKLLGRAEKTGDGDVYAVVSPALVKNDCMLAGVEDVFNAIRIRGDKIGEILLYGKGAGKDATASAVVADVLDCLRLPGFDPTYSWKKNDGRALAPYEKKTLRLFVRGYAVSSRAADEIRESFDGAELIARDRAPENEIAFVTGPATEESLREILSQTRDFTPVSVIRVLD